MDLDIADFNKARGFLIGWSVLVFVLWFFGADLQNFKLLGNEIKFGRNKDHIWLLLLIVNAYLLLRFFQRLAKGVFQFTSEMEDIYDDILIGRALKVFRKEHAPDMLAALKSGKDDGEYSIVKLDAKMFHASIMNRPRRRTLEHEARNGVEVTLCWSGSESSGRSTARDVVPDVRSVKYLRLFSLIKGAFVTPWATDYILPILVACFTMTVSICVWLELVLGE